jgi:pSer/pThr/pTyr-binding forkhead associated (FHA) protein
MPQLVLKFHDKIMKVVELDKPLVTIGRKAKNDLVIDNLVVSSYHAQVVQEQGMFFIEDRGSTNGTFLNDRKIERLQLKNGDEIKIGKHVVVFQDFTGSAGASAEPSFAEPRPEASDRILTAFDETENELGQAAAAPGIDSSAQVSGKEGSLLVVSGQTDKNQYGLVDKISIIGSQKGATVKLTKWLSPKVAALITHRDGVYTISGSDAKNKILINGLPVQGRADLNDGDLVEVAGVKMYFYLTRPSS